MVVMSVAIVDSSKTLVSRQFVEMSRLRVEGLLSAFPRFVESGRDHTSIETETVRYVYQPLGSLYLVLVTSKSSNILADLETLRLLAKVVQDCCQAHVNETLVLKHAFDIVFAFDEVIAFGYHESVTLSQIKTYKEMESQEEKVVRITEATKIRAAREMAKKKARELERCYPPRPSALDIGQRDDRGDKLVSFSSSSLQECMSAVSVADKIDSALWSKNVSNERDLALFEPKAPKKSMVLPKRRPGDILEGIGLAIVPGFSEATTEKVESVALAVVSPLWDRVKVEIDERIKANLDAEGNLNGEAECSGDFKVTVFDACKADLVCFRLAEHDPSFKYNVHPNLDKASHANHVLEVRDAAKAYRANVETPLLKWRLILPREGLLPIAFNVWHSRTADGTTIVLEYDLSATDVSLEDVHIIFPCPTSESPAIASADPGEAAYDIGNQQLHWTIPTVDSREGASGILEFTAAADASSLFPCQFTALRRGACTCPVDILDCYHKETKELVAYALSKKSTYTLTLGA